MAKYKKVSQEQIIEQFAQPIIDCLESGKIAWNKPFMRMSGVDSAYNYSKNIKNIEKGDITYYQGMMNQLSLGCRKEKYDYPHNAWVTFKGAKELGGNVKRGEEGAYVLYWTIIEFDSEGNKLPQGNKDKSIVAKSIPFLRHFKVFNISQCEGIPMPKVKKATKFKPLKVLKEAQAIVDKYNLREKALKIDIKHDARACYIPSQDRIECPDMRNHVETAKQLGESVTDGKQHYYSTLFHEMIHSSGSKKRLNRLEENFSFGDHEYSKEELVAEIGSAMLCQEAGLNSDNVYKNTLAYCQGWAKKLKSEPKWILWATTRSLTATNYILKGKK